MILSILFSSLLASASPLSGQVVNLIPDDEGLKVIAEQNKNIHVLYLRNSNQNFVAYSDLITQAKAEKRSVSFEVKKDGLLVIEKLKVEAKP